VHQDLLSRGWATDSQFAESLAIGQISPGPTGLWVISLGYFVDGVRGAGLTLIAIALPPLSVLALAGVYRRWGHHAAIQGFVRGLSLAVAGVFAVVLTRILSTAGWNFASVMIALGALLLGVTRRIPVVVILILAALVGIGLS
jgi:chromate transporter